MVRIRIPSVFGIGSDPSLTLDTPYRVQPRDALIMQDKSAGCGCDGGAHLTLRLPIAYLLFRKAEAVGLRVKFARKPAKKWEFGAR